MKKLYTTAFALLVMLSMIMSATALQYKTIYRQNGVSAYADWSETNGDISTYTDLFVTKTDDGTDIYLSICTYNMATYYWSCKSGYKFTTDNVFSMEGKGKLNSASLSEVNIDVYDWEIGTIETLNVKTDWTGTGDVAKGSFKYMSKYGDYMMKGSGSSVYRGATAIGSINGDDLGTSAFAGLSMFKSAYMEMKK